jgi:putative spermidine/putrescine transport system permease protein
VAIVSRVATPRRRRSFGRVGPNLLLILAALYFVVPLLSTARFALQNVPVIKLGWHTLFKNWSFKDLTASFKDPRFGPAMTLSLKLAVGTVLVTLALLLPTAIFVHLRLPKARGLIEFLTVLPYVVPPIAIVAGVSAFFRPHAKWFINSNYSLIPFYVVLALPFTYRSIDAGIRAIDVRTLVDASRSLGATWGTTLRRALVPNLSSAIISSSFLTATVVLGEYTISVSLLKKTLPVFSANYQEENATGAMGLALFVLVASTLLLALLTLATKRRARRKGSDVLPHLGVSPVVTSASSVAIEGLVATITNDPLSEEQPWEP